MSVTVVDDDIVQVQSNSICVQCESNARWNEAGGYHELAESCREYCRNGHKEQSNAITADDV
jgi:hypothetical protein